MALGDTAKLLASLELNSSKFSSGARQAIRDTSSMESAFHRASKSVSILRTALGTGIGFVGAQFTTRILGGLTSTLKEATVGMNASLETSTLQFETLMGNADAARKHVAMLFDFAAKTPFETAPIIEASRIMRTFGGAALDTEANLRLFGDAAAATSSDISEVAMWMSRAYADIQAGRPFGEAAQRLMELGILTPQVRNQLEKMQKEGKKGPVIWDALAKSVGKYSGAMAKQANTWQGLTSSIHDNLMLMSATALKPVFDTAKFGMQEILAYLSTPAANAAVQQFADKLATIVNPANLERGFLKVRDVLTSIPWGEVASGAGAVGKAVLDLATGVPWGSVTEGMKVAGQATKMALDAFLALPEPVKAAVIGAIAVNKITGGAITDLAKNALVGGGGGGGIVGSVLGSVQKVYVVNMPIGGLGGGGISGLAGDAAGAAGGGGWMGKLKTAAKWILPVALGIAIGETLFPVEDPKNMTKKEGTALSGILGPSSAVAKPSGGATRPNVTGGSSADFRKQLAASPLTALTAKQINAVNNAANQAHQDIQRQIGGQLDARRAIEDGDRLLAVYQSGTARDTRWVSKNIADLRALQARFMATGDTQTAAAIGARILQLQSVTSSGLSVLQAQQAALLAATLAKQVITVVTNSVVSSREVTQAQSRQSTNRTLVPV